LIDRIAINLNQQKQQMKKYLIGLLLLSVTEIQSWAGTAAACSAAIRKEMSADSLSDYVGRYEASQNNITLQYELEAVNGKLIATNLTSGQILNLKHINNDDFMVEEMGIPISFMRDGAKKVSEIQMPDGTTWKKLEKLKTEPPSPANYKDYLGRYQLKNNGATATIEVVIKYGKLWALLSANNTNSPITNTGKDSFAINATGEPLKFTRDASDKVTSLRQQESDVFVKLK
jgi:hypothetical protein